MAIDLTPADEAPPIVLDGVLLSAYGGAAYGGVVFCLVFRTRAFLALSPVPGAVGDIREDRSVQPG